MVDGHASVPSLPLSLSVDVRVSSTYVTTVLSYGSLTTRPSGFQLCCRKGPNQILNIGTVDEKRRYFHVKIGVGRGEAWRGRVPTPT